MNPRELTALVAGVPEPDWVGFPKAEPGSDQRVVTTGLWFVGGSVVPVT